MLFVLSKTSPTHIFNTRIRCGTVFKVSLIFLFYTTRGGKALYSAERCIGAACRYFRYPSAALLADAYDHRTRHSVVWGPCVSVEHGADNDERKHWPKPPCMARDMYHRCAKGHSARDFDYNKVHWTKPRIQLWVFGPTRIRFTLTNAHSSHPLVSVRIAKKERGTKRKKV